MYNEEPFCPRQSADDSEDIYMFSPKDIYVSDKTYICPETKPSVLLGKTIDGLHFLGKDGFPQLDIKFAQM